MKRVLSSNLPKVLADANQLEQVFLNLVSNAKDAIDPKGSGVITITSRQSAQTDFVEVLVSDSGEGMDAATINDIFNPFFTTRSEETGLGLSIVDRLVHAWGGDIGVESEPGKGTTFTLRLPDASE